MTPEIVKPAALQSLPGSYLKRHATVLKLAAIAILALLLLIPLHMVGSVLTERLARRDEAVKDITSTWGSAQVVVGPILIVPYKCTRKAWRDQIVNGRAERVEVVEAARLRAFFLPATFKADVRLVPSRLQRGIYEAVVYDGTATISGTFARPAFEEWKVDAQQVLWDEAELAFSLTDLRGAKESLEIRLGDDVSHLKPGSRIDGFTSGVYAQVKGLGRQAETIPFEMKLTFQGSRSLRFAPVGVNNDVRLASTWPDPSFQGAFLPTERKVGAEGFDAHWRVSYYGRSYPQQWTESNAVTAAALMDSLFGADLVSVVDSYRFVERSIKYGILVIALVFAAFFLFEIMASLRVHPFQYTLIGIALCLFYLALLALSEVVSFSAAYWTGAATATFMISLYSARALHGRRRAGAAAGGLAAIYAFLFVILRLQDYSLLIGTAGLFLALGLTMYVTRNIDWYARDSARGSEPVNN